MLTIIKSPNIEYEALNKEELRKMIRKIWEDTGEEPPANVHRCIPVITDPLCPPENVYVMDTEKIGDKIEFGGRLFDPERMFHT